MPITIRQYAEALYDALHETKPEAHDHVIENFISILKDNGALEHYEAIVAEYELLDKAKGTNRDIEMTFARETEVNKGILEDLNAYAGTKADVKTKVDEGLIGGVIIRVDDTLIDASVKGTLEKLKQELSE